MELEQWLADARARVEQRLLKGDQDGAPTPTLFAHRGRQFSSPSLLRRAMRSNITQAEAASSRSRASEAQRELDQALLGMPGPDFYSE